MRHPFAFGSVVMPGTAKLVEEQGELVQVLGKYMMTGGEPAHWSGDLRPALVDELADVSAAIMFFKDHNLTLEERVRYVERMRDKVALFEKWHAEQANE